MNRDDACVVDITCPCCGKPARAWFRKDGIGSCVVQCSWPDCYTGQFAPSAETMLRLLGGFAPAEGGTK